MISGQLVGVADGERRRQEEAIGPRGALEMREGAAGVGPRDLGAAELVVDGGQPLGLRRPLGRAHGAENPLLRVQGLTPAPRLGGEVAQPPQGAQVVAAPLQDLPVVRGGLVVAAQAARFLRALEQLESRGVVGLGAPARADGQEALEGQAERQERADRDRQRHGHSDSGKGSGGGAAARRTTSSPW